MGNKHVLDSTHKNIEKQKTISHEFFTFNSFQPSQVQVLQAAYMKNPSLIIDFYHKGLDLNMNLNPEGWKIIHVACQTGNKELTRFLVAKKADLNAIEFSQNWTPMIVAVFNNHLEIVQLLLSENVDCTKVDKDGMTALAYALEYNNTKIFNALSSKN